ncbi:MAG: type II secretion system minor pseudopilin GspI [Xanthomonadales bacterium]|nr:type II secretion system minor pseudopilin GspI [Xanthomonadales bacterium]
MRVQRGFTLLEVLIALVVVALALLALTRTAGGQISRFDGLRERTLAGWVAANVLSETRIATPLPPVGKRDGRTRLGNRDWRWSLEVKATDDPGMRRLDVAVFAADSNEPSASLTGFGSVQPSP